VSWRTNSLVLVARDIGRHLGLNTYIARVLNGNGYETRYDRVFQGLIIAGDCVWDVGANVGYYTRQFAVRVGKMGSVFAFEPSPLNFSRLTTNCAGMANVHLRKCGLGQENGSLSFLQGADELGATSRVVESTADGISVDIRTGESLIADGYALPPNAVKVDVEGFEYEMLQGLGRHLGDVSLRAVGIEMHFGIAKERGVPQIPMLIEALLQRHGFRIAWPDHSHLLATRP